MPRTFVKPKIVRKLPAFNTGVLEVRNPRAMPRPVMPRASDAKKAGKDINRLFIKLSLTTPSKTLLAERDRLQMKRAKVLAVEEYFKAGLFSKKKAESYPAATKVATRMMADKLVRYTRIGIKTPTLQKKLVAGKLTNNIINLPKVKKKINELSSVGEIERRERINKMKKKVSLELSENWDKLNGLSKSRKR